MISGGKDSLTLLYALSGLRRYYPKYFSLHAVTIDLGFQNMNLDQITALCQELDVPYSIIKTDIGKLYLKNVRKKIPVPYVLK